MRCGFTLSSDEEIKIAVEFFDSIGMTWLNEDRLTGISKEFLHVEFFDMPDILRTYSIQCMPDVLKISSVGITFYLVSNPGDYPLESTEDRLDGAIFCPMSNIKSINTFGELKLNRLDR